MFPKTRNSSWIATTIVSLLAACWLLSARSVAATPAARKKFFVSEINADYACTGTSQQALRAQVLSALPHSVLNARGYIYEDPQIYRSHNAARGHPSPYNIADLDRYLRDLRLDQMFFMEVSCVPGFAREHPGYQLTVRLTDRERLSRLLSCPASHQAWQPDAFGHRRLVCNADTGIVEAVTVCTRDFGNFRKDLQRVIKQCVAELLAMPELQSYNSEVTHDPGYEISQFIQVIPHEPKRLSNTFLPEAPEKTPAQRQYRILAEVFELPADMAESVCKRPEQHIRQVRCSIDRNQRDCVNQGSEKLAVVRKLRTLTLAKAAHNKQEQQQQLGMQIAFRAADYPVDYLFRAVVVEQAQSASSSSDTGLQEISEPVTYCQKVRTRPHWLGLTQKLPILFDLAALADPANPVQPAAGLLQPAYGLELQYSLALPTTMLRSAAFASHFFGAAIGSGYLRGIYPCYSLNYKTCRHDNTFRLVDSTSIDFHISYQAEVVRYGIFGLRMFANFGIGVELLNSQPTYRKDGWKGFYDVAVGLAISLPLGSGRTALGDTQVGVGWLTRMRFSVNQDFQQTGFIERPGVPDGLTGAIVILTTQFGFRSKKSPPAALTGGV